MVGAAGVAMGLGFGFLAVLAVIAGYFLLVVCYEAYASRDNQRERTARRRARRSETGLYGWPMGDVETQAVTVTPRVVAAPATAAAPAPVVDTAVEDWPESAAVPDEEPPGPAVEEPAEPIES